MLPSLLSLSLAKIVEEDEIARRYDLKIKSHFWKKFVKPSKFWKETPFNIYPNVIVTLDDWCKTKIIYEYLNLRMRAQIVPHNIWRMKAK